MKPNELMTSISVEDLVKNAFCITVDSERRNRFESIFRKMFGVVPMFFNGGVYGSDTRMNCSITHSDLIRTAHAMGLPYITIFEDDAYPRPDAKDLLWHCMQHVPDDAAMVLWGFGRAPADMKKVSEFMHKVEKPDYLWGSHAYTVFSSAYNKYEQLDLRLSDTYWGLCGPTYVASNCFIQFSSEDGVPNTPGFCSMKELLSDDSAWDL